MKLYVGSRNYKPEGYLTVDIDPTMKPDIVADITKMEKIEDGSISEIVAGHVLEHIDWPDSFKAFAEFARVLKIGGCIKIALPDMGALLRMMISGDNAFHVMGLIYGVGGRINRFEQHRYGFTSGMLIDILETLGFGDFDWWNSEFGDGSNGWIPQAEGKNVGMSLNVKATKKGNITVDVTSLYQQLVASPMSDFLTIAAEVRGQENVEKYDGHVSKLYQRIHYQLIYSQQRVRYLESELAERESRLRQT